MLVVVHLIAPAAEAQPTTICASAVECRAQAMDAMAREDFEAAHDFAWRVVQTSPPNDAAAMALLARAQSLSGRADDAFVMLRRLAERGVIVEEAVTDDAFRRTRAHAEWPAIQDIYARLRAAASPAPPAPSISPAPSAAPAPAVRRAPATSARASKPAAPSTSTPPASPALPVPPALSALPASPALPALALPPAIVNPVAMAYDAVSQRFVVADGHDEVLKVVSEATGNAANLVSPGWNGAARTRAIAIDTRRGDLWVAAVDGARSVLHRMQLISGRRLQDITAPETIGEASFAAIAISREAVFVLDERGRRILVLAAGATALREHTQLAGDMTPTGLAVSGTALYVAHRDGITRIDLRTPGQRAVAAPDGGTIAGLHSLAWTPGGLLGIQELGGTPTLVRVALNARGTAATRVEMVQPARSITGTFAGGTYHYLSEDERGVTIRRQPIP